LELENIVVSKSKEEALLGALWNLEKVKTSKEKDAIITIAKALISEKYELESQREVLTDEKKILVEEKDRRVRGEDRRKG
jgi:predicted P-loop ATPase